MQRENDKFRGSSRSCKQGGGVEGGGWLGRGSNPGGMQRSEARVPQAHIADGDREFSQAFLAL